MHATRKLMSSALALWQWLLGLLASLAARILIWARERQILAERAAKRMLLVVAFLLVLGNLARAEITPSPDDLHQYRTANQCSSTLLEVKKSSAVITRPCAQAALADRWYVSEYEPERAWGEPASAAFWV